MALIIGLCKNLLLAVVLGQAITTLLVLAHVAKHCLLPGRPPRGLGAAGGRPGRAAWKARGEGSPTAVST